MKQILLIDGNSMLFRAYYGTQSRGLMMSRDGVVTNAVYGFSTMINKALELLKPDYVMVAFDTGKPTFRHEMFPSYKGTRKEVDVELVSQFALVREFLDAHGIPRIELEGFEADDIIGTLSRQFPQNHVNILTSDRDMLQLIDDHVHVLLMKKGISDLKTMDVRALLEDYGITPAQVVDVKALQGDTSDNIPGVPSIGPKTATTLINQYTTLDELYQNADALKGKAGENIRTYEAQARLSYDLAKIKCDIPNDVNLDTMLLHEQPQTLNAFYRKYDMNSLIKTELQEEITNDDLTIAAPVALTIEEFDASWVASTRVIALDLDSHDQVQGVFLGNGDSVAYLTLPEMLLNADFKALMERTEPLIALESKVLYRFALDHQFDVNQDFEDVMILAFITDSSLTTLDRLRDTYNLWFGLDRHGEMLTLMTHIGDLFASLKEKAVTDDVFKVYETIEKPLVSVLAGCEFEGICVDRGVLDAIAAKTLAKLEQLSTEIYALAGREFNINSPKQLGEVLFDELGLKSGKKKSTAVDVLESLVDKHPIITPVLAHRKYQKLYSTYAVGLVKYIEKDGKIHTSFNQHATQTGRLSSSNPNLQNISVRDEEAREVRQAFVASAGRVLLSIDYSQIELRVLAYLANEENMMRAFLNHEDIHQTTAHQMFDVATIDAKMRRQAKAVNFGIVYGISAFGLSSQIEASVEEASRFMNRYHEVFPKIKGYMQGLIAMCEAKGYVETYYGRRRYIPEINNKNRAVKEFGKRAAMNAPIQGTAADIIKLAMIHADRLIRERQLKSRMILQVHDELIFDVYEDELDVMQSLMVETMQSVVDWPIPLEVSADVGKTWAD